MVAMVGVAMEVACEVGEASAAEALAVVVLVVAATEAGATVAD